MHNLGELDWHHADAPLTPWADGFAQWMRAKLETRDIDALIDWQSQAPHARRAHPTVEHLMPLFVAWGAAGPHARAYDLHRTWQYGSMALHSFAFR